ncbi:MAG TPA: VWA domain-containing protein [Mycobacteriales bacterium]|nr:VWA domain-containing protein [Mycobacteriales bacterium]
MPVSLPSGFLVPSRLWLLVVVAALAAGYVVVQRRRRAYAVRFTALPLLASVAPRRPGWRRHVPAALLLLSLVVLTGAFARPEADVRVPREAATVVVAIDVSLSMQAVDVEPDRFTAAKDAASAFVDGLPEEFAVGLVSFSGGAAIAVPPTQDHEEVVRGIEELTLGPSTAIGEAVYASLEAVRLVQPVDGGPAAPARVVLLTDGTNTVGRDVESAAAAAADAGVPVSTIAFGTPEGVVDVQGQLVPVPVDALAMERLAEATGGSAFTAQSGDELSAVYDDIGEQVGTTTERREVTDAATGLGLGLVLLAAAASLAWTSRLP